MAQAVIFLVHRPFSGDVIGMDNDEFNEYMRIPDNHGLEFKVEVAFPDDNHACEALIESEVQPLD